MHIAAYLANIFNRRHELIYKRLRDLLTCNQHAIKLGMQELRPKFILMKVSNETWWGANSKNIGFNRCLLLQNQTLPIYQTGSITNKFSRHNKINRVEYAWCARVRRESGGGTLVTVAKLSRLHCLLKYLLTIIDKASERKFCSR